MRFDPRRRLTRPIPGAAIGVEGEPTERIFERDQPLERPSPIPARDTAELRSTTVRMTSRTAETRPNAPQLIRLVRHPYALATARPKRVAYRGETPESLDLSRPDWHGQVRAALAERVRLRSTSGVESRPLPFTVRPSQWQLMPSPPPESE